MMRRAFLRIRLPRAVVALGMVSLLNDASSEMIYPLLPLFLAQLGASVAFIGLIEGIAETTASLLKLGSGLAGRPTRLAQRADRTRLRFGSLYTPVARADHGALAGAVPALC
jgi:hypothetical protein